MTPKDKGQEHPLPDAGNMHHEPNCYVLHDEEVGKINDVLAWVQENSKAWRPPPGFTEVQWMEEIEEVIWLIDHPVERHTTKSTNEWLEELNGTERS